MHSLADKILVPEKRNIVRIFIWIQPVISILSVHENEFLISFQHLFECF